MVDELWSSVDRYFARALGGTDPVMDAALAESKRAGLPEIAVSANQGRLLMLLALAMGARRVLEVGTLGGYSTIWLARGLPAEGSVVSLELSPEHAAVARRNIAAARPPCPVEVIVGPALQTMPRVVAASGRTFDLVFIDADKASIPEYFELALQGTRPGGVIIVDNVVRGGKVVEDSADESAAGVRRLVERLGGDRRVRATAIQTVGEKGHDGFLMAVVA